jgi:hypothetical protein
MKVAVILFAAVATVHSASMRAVPPPLPGWSSTTPPPSGWSSTTTTQGWSSTTPKPPGWSSTTAAPGWPSTTTTQGWSSTAPPPPPGWSSTTAAPGWPSTTTTGWPSTTTTQGWSSTAPPPPPGWSSTTAAPGWPSTTTTQGWSSTTPGWHGKAGWSSTTPGWPAAAPPAPVGTITDIELNAALAAAGSGWAGENHAENVQVTGAGGWGPNANLVIAAGGESVVDQSGSILQVTSQDAEQASSLNAVSVGQIAEGSEGEVVDASGLQISNIQSGWAAASGEGASAAEADSLLTVNPAPLGMAKP